jgi:hypothetical protein
MRPGGHYEISDENVLKGPKVIQLLRTTIEIRKEHKKLSDQVAECETRANGTAHMAYILEDKGWYMAHAQHQL